MSRTVLVTGGAGYVGSHTCKALVGAGYEPVVYDNLSTGNRWAVRWGPLEVGDLLDSSRLHEVMKAYRPTAVMHFAALALVGESMQEPARYYRNNVVGTMNLLDTCRTHDVGIVVFSSTCAVYGSPERLPIAEDAVKKPSNPYGASKLAAERMLGDYGMAYGLRHATLRYFNAAGADPDGELGECRAVETHLIPLALDAVLGRRPPLQIFGTDHPTPDGTAIRDYVHVHDLAQAHVRTMEYLSVDGPSVAVNLGTGAGHSVREVLRTTADITGHDVPHHCSERRPGDPSELVADPSLSHQLLGPAVTNTSSLQSIVESAWRWHRQLTSIRIRC